MEITLGKKTTYPDKYDKSILAPINRNERREGYSIMYGTDVWTAFEVSFLLQNGLPTSLVLRIFNPADSVNIFESKSLKLYLNSYNNTVFESEEQALSRIQEDLSEVAGGTVIVKKVTEFPPEERWFQGAKCLEEEVGGSIVIEEYTHNPNLLEVTHSKNEPRTVFSNLLRSNCEITNQPDWARVVISYEGDLEVTPESLLKYIVSYRNHQEFHEPTCERIYQDLYKVLEKPRRLMVTCQYTRRGGIDINPVRTSYPIMKRLDLPKLLQQ